MNTALYELLDIMRGNVYIEVYEDDNLVLSGTVDEVKYDEYFNEYKDLGINDVYVRGRKSNKTVYLICEPA